MKRYKINKLTGSTPMWKFKGSTDDYSKQVQEFEELKGRDGVQGLRITDTKTNEIVYEKMI